MNVSTMLQVSFFSANMYAKSLSEFKRYIISYSNVHLVLCITLEYIIRTCLVWGRKGNGTAIAQSVVREYSLWMHHMLIFDMHIMYVNKFCVRSKQLHGVREIKKKTRTQQDSCSERATSTTDVRYVCAILCHCWILATTPNLTPPHPISTKFSQIKQCAVGAVTVRIQFYRMEAVVMAMLLIHLRC